MHIFLHTQKVMYIIIQNMKIKPLIFFFKFSAPKSPQLKYETKACETECKLHFNTTICNFKCTIPDVGGRFQCI